MIFVVDEQLFALEPLLLNVEQRGFEVTTLRNADEAFVTLCEIPVADVELVIIDVMLAVADPVTSPFTQERTASYLETGLCLLSDLCPQNPDVFPYRAVFLTNTSNPTTLDAASRVCQALDVPLWKKSEFYAPSVFGQRVEDRVRDLE